MKPMYLARIYYGRQPIVFTVDPESGLKTDGDRIIKVQREGWARWIHDKPASNPLRKRIGVAGLSTSREGAIASAHVLLEQELLEQKGSNRICRQSQPETTDE